MDMTFSLVCCYTGSLGMSWQGFDHWCAWGSRGLPTCTPPVGRVIASSRAHHNHPCGRWSTTHGPVLRAPSSSVDAGGAGGDPPAHVCVAYTTLRYTQL